MVTTAFLQFVLFAIHDDGRDLLVHEDQNCAQQSWNDGKNARVERIFLVVRQNQPAARLQSRLELRRNVEFRCWNLRYEVEKGHRENGDDNGEIADDLADIGWEEKSVLEVLQDGRNEKSSEE